MQLLDLKDLPRSGERSFQVGTKLGPPSLRGLILMTQAPGLNGYAAEDVNCS